MSIAMFTGGYITRHLNTSCMRRCLRYIFGVQIPSQQVFGCIGIYIYICIYIYIYVYTKVARKSPFFLGDVYLNTWLLFSSSCGVELGSKPLLSMDHGNLWNTTKATPPAHKALLTRK